jgi:TonB-linked SusC/RagA family outer membrane protein
MKELLKKLWAGIKFILCSKQLLTMRIVLFFSIISMVQAFAVGSYAQNTRLSLKMQNATIEDVLDEIENNSDFFFMYNKKLVDVNRKVDVIVKNKRIKDILTKIFKDSGTKFTVVDKQILLMPGQSVKNISTAQAQQQQKKVTLKGYVVDENGDPLPGATVFIQGTETATVTDGNGLYILTVDNAKEITLEISFVGMEKQIVKWTGQDILNVQMERKDKLIDEVYVTGYQTISQERATGSFAKVDEVELNTYYSPNSKNLLEGKVAGLSTYGDKITIRGISTFKANSEPLVVVDGLPLEGQTIDDINPNDIESVTVLKDAAAASIYGARAANGVIVIVTKSAAKNRTEVDFSMNITTTPKDDKDYLYLTGISDYIDYEKNYLHNIPAYQDDPVGYFDNKDQNDIWYSPVYYLYSELARGNMTEEEVNQKLNEFKGREEYRKQYYDNALQNQLMQQYNMSFRSGTAKSNLVLSVNALTNKHEQIKTGDEKYTLFFKNSLNLYKWFRVTYGVNMVISKGYSPAADIYDAQPYEQLLDANGNRVYRDLINQAWADSLRKPENIAMGIYDLRYNALDEFDYNSEDQSSTNTRLFMDANFKLSGSLNYDLMFQYNVSNSSQKVFKSEDSYSMRFDLDKYAVFTPAPAPWLSDKYVFNLPKGGRLDNSYSKSNSYTLRNQINFNHLYSEKHAVTALAGFEMSETKHEGLSSNLYGYDDQTLAGQTAVDYSRRRLTGALYPTEIPFISPYTHRKERTDRYVSIYANAGYTYNNRYSLTGSFRIDQTNLFGTDPKYRYRPLWSVGGSWVLTEEELLKNSDALNYLKLRVSYGIGGNVDHNTSPYLQASLGTSINTGNPITTIHTPPNPLLRWEKTTTTNIGFDYAFFKNRLSGSIDGYWKYSDDLLAKKQFDPSLGFTEGMVNNGAMSNNGFELSVSYNWINKKDWSVSTILTAAYNKNKVEGIDYEPDVANDLLGVYDYYLEDNPISAIYAYEYEGLNDNGDPLVHDILPDADGNERDTIISDNYVQNYKALLFMGQTDPKWSGSFQPIIRFKGLELTALFAFYTGNVVRDDVTPLYRELKGGYIHGDLVNAWRPDNKNTDIPRMASQDLTDGYRNKNWQYAEVNIINASTINLRNVVLSYTLPRDWSRAVKARMIRASFQVNNPWYAVSDLSSKYKSKPILPFYVFGLNINF